jgi:hypothetical protein
MLFLSPLIFVLYSCVLIAGIVLNTQRRSGAKQAFLDSDF